LVPKRIWCAELTLMTVIKAYNMTIKNVLRKSSLQVILTFEWIVMGKYKELDEEWDLIFEFVQNFTKDKHLMQYKEGAEGFNRLFCAIRNVYINNGYRGDPEKLFQIYLMVKDYINDTMFDIIYLNYICEKYDTTMMEEYLSKYLDLTTLLKLKENPEYKSICDNRLTQIFGGIENIYKMTRSIEKREIIEKVLMEKSVEWGGLPLSSDTQLNIIQLLKTISLNTINLDVFQRIIRLFVGFIYRAQENSLSPKHLIMSKVINNVMQMPVQNMQNEELISGKVSHQALFQLFFEFYSKFPPTKLVSVLFGFLDALQAGNKETKMLTLDFLGKLSYDHEFCLFIEGWNAKSCLYAKENAGCSFPPQKIVSTVLLFIKNDVDKDLILAALQTLNNLFKNHYSLLEVDIEKMLEQLLILLGYSVRAKEILISMKIVNLINLIITQKGNPADPPEKQIVTISVAGTLLIFAECLNQITIISSFLKADIEEFKRSKQWKKIQNMPNRWYQEMGIFATKPLNQQLAQLIKSMMKLICLIFYISKEEIQSYVENLISILRMFANEHILAQKFNSTIQDIIFNLYISGFMQRLTIDNLLNLIDICLVLGWRNLYFLSDQAIPTLQEHIKGKAFFGSKQNEIITNGPDYGQAERKTAITISQITFPAGETGKKLIEEGDSKYKIKGKIEIQIGGYFDYQNDAYFVMHHTSLNLIRLFMILPKNLRNDTLTYISKLMNLEIKNEQSMILQQSFIVNELISWYSYGNLARNANLNNSSVNEKFLDHIKEIPQGKLYLFNDILMHYFTNSSSVILKSRNITTNSYIATDFKKQPLSKIYKSPKENFDCLSLIRKDILTEKIINPKEQEPNISPEFLLANSPLANFCRINEKTTGWEPVEMNAEFGNLLEDLDEIPVFDTYSIAILYVPSNSQISEQSIYSVKDFSIRFEQFLSEIGSFISIKDCCDSYHLGGLPKNGADGLYGIIWRDELSQIFFHVNVLMQHIDENANKYRNLRGVVNSEEEAMVTKLISNVGSTKLEEIDQKPLSIEEKQELIKVKIKRYFNSDNIVIIWNENTQPIPLDLFKDGKLCIFIIITPLLSNYCKIQIIDVFLKFDNENRNHQKNTWEKKEIMRKIMDYLRVLE